jgi:Tfp pilus assembly protein PilF
MKKPQADRHPFSVDRRVGAGMCAVALALFVLTAGRTFFPGYPADALWARLGGEFPLPVLHPLWGGAVRLLDGIPGITAARAVNLFSALCGAACAGLLAALMGRVRYRGLLVDSAPDRFVRERQARRLSGWVAGLYLAVSIPFWTASTRSLPDSFHLFLLLLAAWLFSQFQQQGRLRHLAALGLLYGAGLVESPLFLLFLPVLVVRVLSELYRLRAIRSRRAHLLFWGGLLMGMGLLPLHLADLAGRSAHLGPAPHLGGLLWEFGHAQVAAAVKFRLHSGFLALMFLAIVPWTMVFVLSRRSPWNYDLDQVLVRYVFLAGLLAVLYDAPFSFWRILGFAGLMLPAHALLAASLGFIAGELWIDGGRMLPSDAGFFRRAVRRASWGAALLLPVLILGAGVRNRPITDTRPAEAVRQAADDMLDRLNGRDVVFADPGMDVPLKLAARERKHPLILMQIRQLNSPVYLRRQARRFPAGPLRDALRAGKIDRFLEALLLTEEGMGRVAFLDLADVFRPYGYLVPDRWIYRLAAAAGEVDWISLAESQQPFWERWSGPVRVHPGNPARFHLDQLQNQAAKSANNLGVALAEKGHASAAESAFRAAMRLNPDNLCARMNLADLLNDRAPAEAEALAAGVEAVSRHQERVLWALSIHHGFLLDAPGWVQRDAIWALSGQPLGIQAGRRQPVRTDLPALAREQFLDQVYLQWGRKPADEFILRASLTRDERNLPVFRELVRLAIRRNDPVVADAYLAQALKLGLPDRQAAFDRAMIAFLRDGQHAAEDILDDLVREDPAHVRAWLARALWAEPDSETEQQALSRLRELDPKESGVHLALAWRQMGRQDWASARTACETAIHLDRQSALAWELLLAWAQAREDPALIQACRMALRELSPTHPQHALDAAASFARRQNWEPAEEVLRAALHHSRNPDLLHALAGIIMAQVGDWAEARALLDEAIMRRPFQPDYRLTRMEVLYRLNDGDAAEEDRLVLAKIAPESIRWRWLEMKWRAARGEDPLPPDRLRELARRRNELRLEQQNELKKWIATGQTK